MGELSRAFLARAPEAIREVVGDGDLVALEVALATALDGARAAWPGVTAPIDDVLALAGERAATSIGPFPERVAALQMADLYIACACAAGDSGAVRAFRDRYFSSLPAVLSRVGGDDALADEVGQTLLEKLLVAQGGQRPRILDLAGQGDLAALVRVAAVRTALNIRRSGQRLELVDHPSVVSGVVLGPDPGSGIIKELESAEVKRAFEDAIAALEPRERNVLRLHLLHGLGIDEIGRIHGVHRSTAARWIDRIRGQLRGHTARLLRQRLSLGSAEVDSLVRYVQSRLDISFDRVLASK
jgi:RNA polymerase sigma-70 factor (ECF subfamily)